MLSKAQIQFVRSLHQKKFRNEHQKFIAEGPVLVEEALSSGFKVESIYATEAGKERFKNFSLKETEIIEIAKAELERISLLKQPHEMLAVVEMKETKPGHPEISNLVLALDQIADPGNMGTIIRVADWFGIYQIVCSEDCVEVYNPKVVQATMGSLFRVEVHYASLSDFIQNSKKNDPGLKVYGTLLSGKNIYSEKLSAKGIIIMGNESRGISEGLQKLIDEPLTIPFFNKSQHAESLNVAIATAIICSEFRRRS